MLDLFEARDVGEPRAVNLLLIQLCFLNSNHINIIVSGEIA
jgi:hypothetical protein